ncbi:GNAT family N-acetyltransferase [Streptomyces mirabilis]|uniref:GNAT family N-acetyltransferase n=1 Tax=Streptomyces mirabilis TaxID=68239 RepID=UPI00381C3012
MGHATPRSAGDHTSTATPVSPGRACKWGRVSEPAVIASMIAAWTASDTTKGVPTLILDGEELEQLYLDPSWRGRGVGDRFMDLAKQQRPDGLGLWTFQVNGPAQRFYERHGFIAVEHTDGLRNEEHEPDVRYTWQPHEQDPR